MLLGHTDMLLGHTDMLLGLELVSGCNRKISVTIGNLLYDFGSGERHSELAREM